MSRYRGWNREETKVAGRPVDNPDTIRVEEYAPCSTLPTLGRGPTVSVLGNAHCM